MTDTFNDNNMNDTLLDTDLVLEFIPQYIESATRSAEGILQLVAEIERQPIDKKRLELVKQLYTFVLLSLDYAEKSGFGDQLIPIFKLPLSKLHAALENPQIID